MPVDQLFLIAHVVPSLLYISGLRTVLPASIRLIRAFFWNEVPNRPNLAPSLDLSARGVLLLHFLVFDFLKITNRVFLGGCGSFGWVLLGSNLSQSPSL